MQEIVAKVTEQVRGSWRFRRFALIAAWLVACFGWVAVFAMPDLYQANSRVFVDTKTALKPVITGIAIDQDVNAQVNSVRQSLLSQPQLEPVAVKVGLVDRRTMDAPQVARVLASMRDHIELTVHKAGENDDKDAGNIYSIQYTDTKRERALQVVETLQMNLIENTIGGKRQGSEDAERFLDQQIRDYEARLRDAEDRLANFKKTNVGLMPTEEGGYFQRLQLEMDAVQKTQTALSVATSRREELSRQLRGDAVLASTSVPTSQGGNGVAGDTLSQIKATQARLDDLLLRFTDKHPDVMAARENLAQLKARRETEIAALKHGDPNAIANSSLSANPVYQSIQLQLNQADVEIASLRRELGGHESKVAELRKNLDTMPQVEAEFARLDRDYGVTKANYTELVQRRDKARLGIDAQQSGSVRFDVVEPPNAAFQPISPKRSLLILAVFAGAIGFGAAVAFLIHQLRPVFTSARDLASITGLTVLGSVSSAWIENQKRIRRNSYIRYAVALGGLFVLGVVVLKLSNNGVRLSSLKGS
jgi:polysaccharide chain length determinant protein (PEP-CTERM system associated)